MITSGAAPDAQKLDQFYVHNPAGPGIIYLLWHEPTGAAVGITCAGRRDVLVGQSILKGAVCGDLVIDPAHRSLGPSLLLHKTAMKGSLDEFDLFYAFPNERAATVISVQPNAIHGELVNMVLPLRVSQYLTRYLPKPFASVVGAPAQLVLDLILAIRIPHKDNAYRETTADDAFVDALWATIVASDASMGVRDSKFLKWRLPQYPLAEVAVFGVTHHGSPAGYVAYGVKDDTNVKIVDVLALDETAFRASIALFIKAMRKRRAPSVSIRQTVDFPARLQFLKKLGFVVSTRSKSFVFGKGSIRERLEKKRLYLNAVDSDV